MGVQHPHIDNSIVNTDLKLFKKVKISIKMGVPCRYPWERQDKNMILEILINQALAIQEVDGQDQIRSGRSHFFNIP